MNWQSFVSKLCRKACFCVQSESVQVYLTSLEELVCISLSNTLRPQHYTAACVFVYSLLAGGRHHGVWMEQSSLESIHQFLCTVNKSVLTILCKNYRFIMKCFIKKILHYKCSILPLCHGQNYMPETLLEMMATSRQAKCKVKGYIHNWPSK